MYNCLFSALYVCVDSRSLLVQLNVELLAGPLRCAPSSMNPYLGRGVVHTLDVRFARARFVFGGLRAQFEREKSTASTMRRKEIRQTEQPATLK